MVRSNTKRIGVRDKIVDAFWDLLLEYPMSQISVEMVVRRAGCNRGSFYYHFDNRQDLVEFVGREELLGVYGIQYSIYEILARPDAETLGRLSNPDHFKRIALFMNRGGADMIKREAKAYLVDAWNAVLRPRGNGLKAETRLISDFCVASVLGLVAHIGEQELAGRHIGLPAEYLSEFVDMSIRRIATLEGVAPADLRARMQTIVR